MNPFETGMAKLLHAQLAELYYCEHEMAEALQAMAVAARSDALSELFRMHRKETLSQAKKLEAVFAELDIVPRAQQCRAVEGLLTAGRMKQSAMEDDAVRDMALIAQAEKMEQFEITSYTNLLRLARLLGKTNVVAVCSGILEEEKDTHGALTALLEEQLVEQGC